MLLWSARVMIENVSVVIEKISATQPALGRCQGVSVIPYTNETEADEWVGYNTWRGDSNVTSLVPATHQGVIHEKPSHSNSSCENKICKYLHLTLINQIP